MTADPLPSLRTEYQRYRRLAELALEQVADADLCRALDPDGNSIAVLVRHLAGNLRSRFTDFLTSDGEKPWRQRDEEFAATTASRRELLAAWQAGWDAVDRALADVAAAGPEAGGRSVAIRGQPLSVLDALARSVAHVAYHTGQIVLLARTFQGPSWRSLSIPRGGSVAYAAHPTRERSPDGR